MYGFYEFKEQDAFNFARHMMAETSIRNRELFFKTCPYCRPKPTRDNIKTFSIDLDTGKFKCFRASCGAHGNMVTLAKDFDFSLGNEVDEYYKPRRVFNNKAIETFRKRKEAIVPKPEAVQYLESRGISEEVAKRYEITVQTGKTNILVFPFYDENGVLQFVKYRKTDFDKEKDNNKEWCEKDCKPILFGMKQCEDFSSLVITEGQIDSLSVSSAGIKNAVSVPTGANGFTWIPYCWNWVNQFEEIIVFGDYEKGHITILDEIKKRFKKTIKHVREEDYKDCKDANDILRKYGAEQIRYCIENAVMVPIRKIIQLSDVQDVDLNNIQKLKTGIKQVDNLLYGGPEFGGVVLISGKAGEGKLLADDTPVFTKNGWKNHGDLVVGDRVYGIDGKLKRVTHIFQKNYADCLVTFTNGEQIQCHENHEWVVYDRMFEHREKIISTKELFSIPSHVFGMNGKSAYFYKIPDRPGIDGATPCLHDVYIKSVERVSPKIGNCIEVEGGIYCAGKSMIPTHNSTLASQILVNAIHQNYKCLAYSGELPNFRFKSWIDLQIAGGRHIFECQNKWGDKGYSISKSNKQMISDWYRGKFFLYDNSAIDAEDDEKESLVKIVENAILQYGIKVVLLDNLMTAMDLEPLSAFDKYEKQSQFVKKLARIALTYDVLIFLVAHKRKNNFSLNENDEVSGSGDISNLASYVIAYEKCKYIEPSQRLCKVTKNRIFGNVETEGYILNFDEKSKRIYGQGDDLYVDYGWDNFIPLDGETPFD